MVLTGKIPVSGKLTDTIAYELADYPSTANFGDDNSNTHVEDIYVGYRYFETFAPERVMYPFGFGLTYTTFTIETEKAESTADAINFQVKVTNTGDYAGKEVVQIYLCAPQGKLGRRRENWLRLPRPDYYSRGRCRNWNCPFPFPD